MSSAPKTVRPETRRPLTALAVGLGVWAAIPLLLLIVWLATSTGLTLLVLLLVMIYLAAFLGALAYLVALRVEDKREATSRAVLFAALVPIIPFLVAFIFGTLADPDHPPLAVRLFFGVLFMVIGSAVSLVTGSIAAGVYWAWLRSNAEEGAEV